MADDSILFRPGPVLGRPWTEERPAPPGLLTWYPVLAVYRANARAARRYRPGSYPDGLVLLRAAETPHGRVLAQWLVAGAPGSACPAGHIGC